MENDTIEKLTGINLFSYLILDFGMSGNKAIKTMKDKKQDLKWYYDLSKRERDNILRTSHRDFKRMYNLISEG